VLPEERVRFLVAATRGNPLAWEELPMLLESEKLTGTVPLSEPLPSPSRLEETFGRGSRRWASGNLGSAAAVWLKSTV
jgi:hypothetical protein